MPIESHRPVFLCHASEDKQEVARLYDRLKKSGFNPWIDIHSLLPGQNWKAEIATAIQTSNAVLICLSRTSIRKRGFVQAEIQFALDAAREVPTGRVFIVPVLLDDCEIPRELADFHAVSIHRRGNFQKLVQSLKLISNGERVDQESGRDAAKGESPTSSNGAISALIGVAQTILNSTDMEAWNSADLAAKQAFSEFLQSVSMSDFDLSLATQLLGGLVVLNDSMKATVGVAGMNHGYFRGLVELYSWQGDSQIELLKSLILERTRTMAGNPAETC